MGLIQKVQGDTPPVTSKGAKGMLRKAGEQAATRAGGQATTGAMAAGMRSLEAASGMRFDPIPAYLFFVELSGVFVALFTECSGLGIEREVKEIKEGGVNNYTHKLPGRVKFGNITLKRGISLSRALWDWMAQGRHNFKVRRLNFSIVQGAPGHNLTTAIAGAVGGAPDALMSLAGQGFGKVKHWDIEDAYPVSWELSDLSTSSGETAIETIEIAHHGLTLSYEVLTPMSLVGGASDLIPL
jgi:phage tail-like protein